MSTLAEILIPTSTVSVSTVQTLTTEPVSTTLSVKLPTIYNYLLSVTTSTPASALHNVLRNKTLKQDAVDKGGLSVDTLIGITFGSVAGIAVLGGGTFLLYRSVSRNSVSPECKDE